MSHGDPVSAATATICLLVGFMSITASRHTDVGEAPVGDAGNMAPPVAVNVLASCRMPFVVKTKVLVGGQQVLVEVSRCRLRS